MVIIQRQLHQGIYSVIAVAVLLMVGAFLQTAAAQGAIYGDDSGLTAMTSMRVGDEDLASGHIPLIELTAGEGSDDVLSVVWRRAQLGWLPAWYIFIESSAGRMATDQTTEGTTGIQLGPVPPLKDHDYEVSLSLRHGTEHAELSVWDRTDQKSIVQHGWQMSAGAASFHTMSDDTVNVPWYQPVATTWDVVTASGTSWVPTYILEPSDRAQIRLRSLSTLPGEFRTVARTGTQEVVVATGRAGVGDLLLPLDASKLPVGLTSVVVQYVEAEQTLWESRPKQLTVGKVLASVTDFQVDFEEEQLQMNVRVKSASHLPNLHLTLQERRTGLAWDSAAGEYMRDDGTVVAIDLGIHDVTPHELIIPVTLPAPQRPGLWESGFALVSEPAVATEMTTTSFTYSTLTSGIVPKSSAASANTIRICTYNILGFQGWPEGRATPALGNLRDPRRLNHFANSLSMLGCDVLGLQEGESVDQMRTLGRQMGGNVVAFPSSTAYPGGIFTRFPVAESRMYNQIGRSAPNELFSAFAGAALLNIGGEPVWVVNIHAWPHDEGKRQREAELVRTKVEGLLAETPNVIVLGDYNSNVDGAIARALTALGFRNAMLVHGRVESTINTGTAAIDHIYVSEALAGRVKRAWVVRDPGFAIHDHTQPGVWANSDHLPVIAELEW